MHYECHECGSPAVKLPEQLNEDAVVRCQGCGKHVATWAAFKHSTTQAVLADSKIAGTSGSAVSYDPLDPGFPHRAEGVVDT